jgi:hypothetical protein
MPLSAYEGHYNSRRQDPARRQLPPNRARQPATIHDLQTQRMQRTHILGGLITNTSTPPEPRRGLSQRHRRHDHDHDHDHDHKGVVATRDGEPHT